jgi:glycosidase
VEAEGEKEPSMLILTHTLLALRRSRTALNSGSYRGLESYSEVCYVYLRQSDHERLIVAINFSEEPQQISIAEPGEGCMIFSTSACRKERINLAELKLQGHEGCIIELLDHSESEKLARIQ